ncbi:MAG: prepilin peptidase [Bdellovibrionota bacterium]
MAISFSAGLIFGSFANVLIARVPQRKSILHPGSACPQCRHAIRWFENIPILSYVALRGRCSSCRKSIPIRYPVVELLTGLLFAALERRYGWSWLLVARDWPLAVLLISITFIDLERRLIPDPLSLGGLVLGLATAFWAPIGILQSFLGAALGFGVFYSFAWLYQRITGRSGLGGGDIKLLAFLGAFVGPTGVLVTILLSSVFGSVVGIVYGLTTSKAKLMKIAIPFGPFLVVGALYYYLFGEQLWFQFMIPT